MGSEWGLFGGGGVFGKPKLYPGNVQQPGSHSEKLALVFVEGLPSSNPIMVVSISQVSIQFASSCPCAPSWLNPIGLGVRV